MQRRGSRRIVADDRGRSGQAATQGIASQVRHDRRGVRRKPDSGRRGRGERSPRVVSAATSGRSFQSISKSCSRSRDVSSRSSVPDCEAMGLAAGVPANLDGRPREPGDLPPPRDTEPEIPVDHVTKRWVEASGFSMRGDANRHGRTARAGCRRPSARPVRRGRTVLSSGPSPPWFTHAGRDRAGRARR